VAEEKPVDAPAATPEGSQPPAPTAAEVEAEYKARLSGKDKAHAAEVQTLKAQIEALSTGGDAATAAAQANAGTAEELRRQLAEAQNEIKQRDQAHTAQLRAAKYPFAADALDPAVLAAMDESKVAGLNARLAPSKPGIGIDPSTPQRTVVAPKPTNEKSSAELRADLERMAPQIAAELRSNLSDG
jgi:DNA segregation ATPase FtsK/SpoIIIE-like protein